MLTNPKTPNKSLAPVQLELNDIVPERLYQKLKQAQDSIQGVEQLLQLRETQYRELQTRFKNLEDWGKLLAEMPIGATLRLLQSHAKLVRVDRDEIAIALPSRQLINRARKDQQTIEEAAKKVWSSQLKITWLLWRKRYN